MSVDIGMPCRPLAGHRAGAGATAVPALLPRFVDRTREGIADRLSDGADLSPLPAVIYNVPGKARNGLMFEPAVRLVRHANVLAVEDSSGDRNEMAALARIGGRHAMTGSDGLILWGPELAPAAFASGFADVAPERVRAVPRLRREGRRGEPVGPSRAAGGPEMDRRLREVMRGAGPDVAGPAA